MHKTLEFIENRIKWRASQHNLPNKRVFLFENLKDEIKMNYSIHFNKKDTGKIVLLFTDSKQNWTALGTKMIIGFDGENVIAVELCTIEDVISKNLKEQQLQYVAGERKLKKIIKRNERELSVTDFCGCSTVFITNKGRDLFALWSILLLIMRLNKKDL
jgi:hypothetical protein